MGVKVLVFVEGILYQNHAMYAKLQLQIWKG